MNSMKCPQCGLVNWATAEACKRCRLPLNGAHAAGGANQWADDTYGYEEETDAGQPYAEQPYAEQSYAQQDASYGYQGEAAHGAWGEQSGYYQGGYRSQDAYQGGHQNSSYGYSGYSEAPKQTGIAIGS